MGEVHIIGQIVSACEFPENNLFCKWAIASGNAWKIISGHVEGQTQVDVPLVNDEAYFCHPLDIHYATRGLQGWPKLYFQIWHHNWVGKNDLYGYGFCHVPTAPGFHEIEVVTWRPVGSLIEQLSSKLVGGGPHLRRLDVVYNPNDRFLLQTESMGKIKLQLNVITRNFAKFGIEL